MLKSTTKEAEGQLNIVTPAEGNQNNSELIYQELIEGTPFRIVCQEDKWFLVTGNHRVTEPTLTRESTEAKLKDEMWLLVMHLAVIVAEKLIMDKKILDLQKEKEPYELDSM